MFPLSTLVFLDLGCMMVVGWVTLFSIGLYRKSGKSTDFLKNYSRKEWEKFKYIHIILDSPSVDFFIIDNTA